MPTPAKSATAADIVRLLLASLQDSDREGAVLHLVELGLWVSVTPDPLPPPDVGVVSSAALTITLNELQIVIRQHREMSKTINERDRSAVAAIIERNTEMMESVAKALSALTPTAGFLMVKG